MTSNEPDIFKLFWTFVFKCVVYVASCGLVVLVGTRVLRWLGVAP